MTSAFFLKGLLALALFHALYLPSFSATLSTQGREPGPEAVKTPSVVYLPLFVLEDQDDKALYLLAQFGADPQEAGKMRQWSEAQILIKALIHRKAGRISKAVEIYRKASDLGADMAAFALYHQGELAFESGNFSWASNYYEAVQKRRSRSALGKLASFKSALAHRKAKEIDKAVHGYSLYISKNKKDRLADAAILGLAEVYYEKEMRLKSAWLYRAIWLDRPQSSYYARARSRYESMVKDSKEAIVKPSCNIMGRHATRLFKLDRYEKSKAAYDEFFSRCPESRPPRNWQINYAVSFYYSRNNDKGVLLLEKTISENPKGPKAEAALYWLAKFFYRLKQSSTLMMAGDLLLSNFPESRYADNIVYLKGSVYGENGRPNKAIHQLKKLITAYKRSPYTVRAWWYIGWLHYSKGNYLNASEAFKEIPARYKTSPLAPDAMYWLGRAQENLGLKDAAIKTYENLASFGPFSYYGLRAGERLRYLNPNARPAFEAQSEIFETQAEKVLEERDSRKGILIRAVKKLLHDLLYEEAEMSARSELNGMPAADRDASSRSQSLCLRPEADSNARSFLQGLLRANSAIGGESPPPRALQMVFPRCYRKSIEHYAAADVLDPNLLYSIVMAESDFDKDALSYVGAIGLMQLMPKTARQVASRLNMPRPHEDQLYGVSLNLKYGSAYLAELMQIFNGELAPAVASYNAPLKEVINWRSKHRSDAPEEFVADIPFYETRKYAQKVLAFYEIYNELYPEVGAWQRGSRR